MAPPRHPPDAGAALRRDLAELARARSLRRCYDCGKCTSVCPVNIGGSLYSPRRLGQLALEDPGPALQSALWDCLTCDACREICPVGVDFPAFVRDARALLATLEQHRELTFLHRPANLEDVFLKLTGHELRD